MFSGFPCCFRVVSALFFCRKADSDTATVVLHARQKHDSEGLFDVCFHALFFSQRGCLLYHKWFCATASACYQRYLSRFRAPIIRDDRQPPPKCWLYASASSKQRHMLCASSARHHMLGYQTTNLSAACSSSSASSSDANTDDDADSSRPAKRSRSAAVVAVGDGTATGQDPTSNQAKCAAGSKTANVPESPAKRHCT